MDPNTGRLRALSEEESSVLSMMQQGTAVEEIPEETLKSTEDVEKIKENLKGLEPLPDELQKEAEKELAGQKETYVDLNSDSPLAKWAADRRKKNTPAMKKKKRRKTAKKSRRINRKK